MAEYDRSYRRRSRSRDRRRSRSRRRRSRSRRRRSRDRSSSRHRHRSPSPRLTRAQRQSLTVFISNFSPKLNEKQVFKFFSQAGKVRDVHILRDHATNKSRSLGYVEFHDIDAVPVAIAFTGHKLAGIPVTVQATQSVEGEEFERAKQDNMPLRLVACGFYSGFSPDEIKPLFAAFGDLEDFTYKTQQHGDDGEQDFCGEVEVQFCRAGEAKVCRRELEGMEICGRTIEFRQISNVATNAATVNNAMSGFDVAALPRGEPMKPSDQMRDDEGAHPSEPSRRAPGAPVDLEEERGELGISASKRHELMRKLARDDEQQHLQQNAVCVRLSNVFDPRQELAQHGSNWAADIQHEFIAECRQFGPLLHVHVDSVDSSGTVHVRFATSDAARACYDRLHGRYFDKRQLQGQLVSVQEYERRFPDSGRGAPL